MAYVDVILLLRTLWFVCICRLNSSATAGKCACDVHIFTVSVVFIHEPKLFIICSNIFL